MAAGLARFVWLVALAACAFAQAASPGVSDSVGQPTLFALSDFFHLNSDGHLKVEQQGSGEMPSGPVPASMDRMEVLRNDFVSGKRA